MSKQTTKEWIIRIVVISAVLIVVLGIPISIARRFFFPPRIVWPPPPHADAGAIMAELVSPTNDLQTRFDYLHEISKYNYLEIASSPSAPAPRFLEIQVFAKVNRVDAQFDLILGRRDEALHQLADGFRWGALMAQPQNHVIARLIGIAVMAINAGGLEIYALNACETPQELETLMSELQDLNARTYRPRYGDMRDRSSNPIAAIQFYNVIKEVKLEGHVRNWVSITRLLLVQAATAARHHHLTAGAYPAQESEFDSLPGGLHTDPFGVGPFRFRMDQETQTYYIYSYGPDKRDDGAAFVYDPTNGTISRGDIFIAIPPEREFPFPREGLRARTMEDVHRQFPNGLPRDPFADTRIGYTICNTQPVSIMSFGPNTDENIYRYNKNPNSGARYYMPLPASTAPGFGAPSSDPAATSAPTTATITLANGTTASGPINPYSPNPFAPNDAPPAGFGVSAQDIKERSFTMRPPPPLIPPTELEPLYDPTNGTVSAGDLFILIPTPTP